MLDSLIYTFIIFEKWDCRLKFFFFKWAFLSAKEQSQPSLHMSYTEKLKLKLKLQDGG